MGTFQGMMMSSLSDLKKCRDIEDVAALLGCKTNALSYLLYIQKPAYQLIKINKKFGGVRELKAPPEKLKRLQKRLADILSSCYEDMYPDSDFKALSHGFMKNKSILTNSTEHRNKRYVLNLDLKNYFDSFNFGRVRGYFMKNRDFLLVDKVATIIAQLSCYENSLPQGSPCSPIITNLIARSLDVKLANLAKAQKCFYSRYVDDLTFSTNLKEFPEKLAKQVEGKIVVGSSLGKVINKEGFAINHAKTRLQYYNSRQEVTGLVVNKFINIPSDYRMGVRAMVHSQFRDNEFFYKEGSLKLKGSMSKLNGMLSYIHSVRSKTIPNNKYEFDAGSIVLDSSDKLYSDFLFYKYFVSNDKPVIVCEGMTDVIYLRSTIKNMAKKFPSLIGVRKGVSTLKIQILPASRTVVTLLGLLSGTGELKKFVEGYEQRLKKYKKPLLNHPVIVLVDNDDGAAGINNLIKHKFKSESEPGKPVLVTQNLLYVRTPELPGKKVTMIEDFFSEQVRAEKLRGKTFSPRLEDGENIAHYGKKIFAEEIVSRKHKYLNFDSFCPVLDLIVKSIDIYSKVKCKS